MAKRTVESEMNNALANGAKLAQDNKFVTADGKPMQIRQMDSDYDPLEEGDTLHIPADYKVVEVKFEENDETSHPCIFIEVTRADGTDRILRWFPNSLCKSINPIVDGKRQARVKTTGSATDLFRSVDTVDEGLALLKGKDIKVAKATVYTHQTRYTNGPRDTHIYQYDLVK